MGEGVYDITAKTNIPSGWFLYGLNPSVEGLESLKFIFANENIQLTGLPVTDPKAKLQADPIFDNTSVSVFETTISVQQRITIKGFVPEKTSFYPRFKFA